MNVRITVLLSVFFFLVLAGCAAPVDLGQALPTVQITPETPFTTIAVATATATLQPSPSVTLTDIPTSTPTPTMTPEPEPIVLAGAGDVAVCGMDYDEQTALLLDQVQPDAVFTAGDTYYSGDTYSGTRCFDESWGAYRDRTFPALGNHEYEYEKDAGSFFTYFSPQVGERGKGYYSYDLGAWHIVVLNSNCLNIDGCGPSSSQVQWLQADLQASTSQCTLAYWHHPRWTSGLAGNSHWLDAFWQVLYEHGADVVVSGHDHDYERFAPQNPAGELDEERGIRQFVVGTGGASLRGFNPPQPNSEVRNAWEHGIIKFTLHPDSYDWEFLTVPDSEIRDSGSRGCH